MAEHFSDREKAYLGRPANLEERLKEYPELKAKMEAMLGIIENAGGDVEKAAEAERRIIEELRQMGNEVLHSWARRQQQKKEEEYNTQPGVNRKEKKSSSGIAEAERLRIGSRSPSNSQRSIPALAMGWRSLICLGMHRLAAMVLRSMPIVRNGREPWTSRRCRRTRWRCAAQRNRCRCFT
jgi:hypothetical protein